MLSIILIASVLVAVTVAVHTAGLTALLLSLRRWRVVSVPRSYGPTIGLLFLMVWWMVLLHLVEISVWGLFYLWWGCLPDAEAALYFSAVTYGCIGYGDLVLAKPWRGLAPIEGLTGILMCGLSSALFFAVMMRIYQTRHGDTAARTTTEGTSSRKHSPPKTIA